MAVVVVVGPDHKQTTEVGSSFILPLVTERTTKYIIILGIPPASNVSNRLPPVQSYKNSFITLHIPRLQCPCEALLYQSHSQFTSANPYATEAALSCRK